jgi:membrane-associated phospholipid phosphatase
VNFIHGQRRAYRPESHDIWSAALFFTFALFSLIWPHTGAFALGSASVPRGYLVAPLLALFGVTALLLGRWDFSRAPALVSFVRCFYPQAFFAPLFEESILLSSQPWGGVPRDAVFARLDQSIFGFQPAREFSNAFGQFPLCNEIMFAAYFSFYFILVLTPWIPWFRGDRAEGERESSIFAGVTLALFVFYALFRVVGPKHYLADLSGGYGALGGGLFTAIEGGILNTAITTGAAFPSSHVGMSLMMTIFVARTERRLLPIYIVDTVLIGLATVYIHAHWAVDVAGGLIVTAALMPLFSRLHSRLAGEGSLSRRRFMV